MRFWDTSAIAGLILDEQSRDRLTAILRHDPVIAVWWGTVVESTSAICRKEREGLLGPDGVAEAISRLRRLQTGWLEIEPHEQLRQIAGRLLRVHPLRAADAFRLAAAISAAQQSTRPLDFVCLDSRLGAAAEREGLVVVA